MKTVIEMAREAGLIVDANQSGFDSLEAFAELVRADEREKYKWDVHSCGPNCTKVACVAMREAVEAEREACAKVCEEQADELYESKAHHKCAEYLAEQIRARGNT